MIAAGSRLGEPVQPAYGQLIRIYLRMSDIRGYIP
jgi:hypothetical protein